MQEAEQVIEGLKANIIVLEATLKTKVTQAEQNGVDAPTRPSISSIRTATSRQLI
jgi:hypothetical protein